MILELIEGMVAKMQHSPPRMRAVAKRELLRHIDGLAVGTRLPSLHQLAGGLGLGRTNLQAAMRDLALQGFVVSRPKLGTYVAKRPRDAAEGPAGAAASRVLAGKRVALVAQDMDDPLISSLARAVRQGIAGMGAELLECSPRLVESVGRGEPGAIDLAIHVNPVLPEYEPLPAHVPNVVVSTAWHESVVMPLPCDLVGVDQVGGSYLAGDLIRRAELMPACFIGVASRTNAQEYGPTSAVRLRGFEAGLGRPVEHEHRLFAIGYSIEGGASGFSRYMKLKHRPRTIFLACDEMAVGFVIAAQAHGLVAGKDYHVIGFDGHRLGRTLQGGALTTVEVPLAAMGQLTAEAAMRRIVSPRRPIQATYLSCHLFRGATLAPSFDIEPHPIRTERSS